MALGLSESARAQNRIATHSVGQLSVEDVSPEVRRDAQQAVRGTDAVGKDGPMAKIGLELALLYHQHRSRGAEGARALVPAVRQSKQPDWRSEQRRAPQRRVQSPVMDDGESVLIDAIAADEPERLLRDLRTLGLRAEDRAGSVVSGRLPITALQDAADLSSLRGMVPSHARVHSVGSVGSEADTSHFVDQARADAGLEGGGQKVCALSDSYDQDSQARTSAVDDIQTGDLPGEGNPEGNTTTIDVLDDSYDEDRFPAPTDEGRAMLQLIHDLAPNAELGFHTAFGGIGRFAQGIRDLADAGCTVIVDDVGYSSEPFYQDGPVSNAVDDVVENDGIPYFASAGNDGQNSYEAPFRNSGEPGVLNESSVAHDFTEDALLTDTRQNITVNSGGTFRIFTFQWTDPSAVVDGSDGPNTDIDIALVDQDGSVVAQSSDDNISNGFPVEGLQYTNDTGGSQTLGLVIEKATGPDPDEIKYIYSGSGFTIEEYDTLGPTVYGHPMAEGAVAVAAAPFYNTARYNSNTDPASLESFSSKGGIPILFDQSGARISAVERQKPNLTGTDGIDNTFFGFDIDDSFFNGVDADPHPNFFGTSAAAPNIAGIAALIRQARPEESPAEIRNRLRSTAQDVTERLNRQGDFVETGPNGGEGVDDWSGYGFVRADRAMPDVTVQIADVQPSSVSFTESTEGQVTLQWRQIGEEGVEAIVVEQRFFDGEYDERTRFTPDGSGEYSRKIENLPPGDHRFRVTAQGSDGPIAQGFTSATVRGPGVRVILHPNPFGNRSQLSITLPEESEGAQQVRITVYDALGRRVAVPVEERMIDDSESVALPPRTLSGLSSGVYFFRVEGETFQRTVQGVRVR